jgi:chain length determinant protein tyrosine kinase EpsG
MQENVLPIEGSGRVLARHDRRIGGILAEQGRLGPREIEGIMKLQQLKGLRFGSAALRLGFVTETDLRRAVAKQYDLDHLLHEVESISSEIVVVREPSHIRAEQVRALRTQLMIRWSIAGPERRALAIASPGSGEGRSYLTANLAVAISQLGERTLLIDADLRNPRQHRIFSIPDQAGLSAVLSGRADPGAVVPVPGFGTLWLLPAGAPPPNPQELLSHQNLAALLQDLHGKFDVILFDTPPAKRYADAQSVAFRAGSALVVARKDYTRLDDAKSVIRDLGDTGARVVGTVINAF